MALLVALFMGLIGESVVPQAFNGAVGRPAIFHAPLEQIQAAMIKPVSAESAAIIGFSTSGLPITVYSFGDGPARVVLIGGIHGAYERNTVLLAYQAIAYFSNHSEAIPHNVTLQIVPAANPDGLRRVAGSPAPLQKNQGLNAIEKGRFNSNNVDLNRNWDCNWQPDAWWGVREVSGGSEPFSEVESRVLRDFLLEGGNTAGVVFWHSAGASVIPGYCEERMHASERLANIYASAAGYQMVAEFSAYTVTGDATDWLARQKIPAIVVELSTHGLTDWNQNRAAILATMEHLNPSPPIPVADVQRR